MNMVRATTAAFAAATGGADSVTVLSPLFEEEPFNARMARNTQTILIEESSLYRAGDPGAGAGAVEALTGELAAAAWQLFTRIEGDGGLIAAVRSGSIQRTVAAMRDSRLDKVVRRQIPLVGVNVHVDRNAVIPPVPPAPATAESDRFGAAPAGPAGGAVREAVRPQHRQERAPAVRAPGPCRSRRRSGGIGGCLRGRRFRSDFRRLSRSARLPRRGACTLGSAGRLRRRRRGWLRGSRRRGIPTSRRRREVVVAAASSSDDAPHGGFDALLTPDTDVVSLCSDVLDRIAESGKNGHS